MKIAERGGGSPSPLDGLLHGQINRRDLLKLPLLAVAADQFDPQTAHAANSLPEAYTFNVLRVVTTASWSSDTVSDPHAAEGFDHVVSAFKGIGADYIGIQPLLSPSSKPLQNFREAAQVIHAGESRAFVEGVVSQDEEVAGSAGLANPEEYLKGLREVFSDSKFRSSFADNDLIIPVKNPEDGMLRYFPDGDPKELARFLLEAKGIVFDAMEKAGTNVGLIQPMNTNELQRVMDRSMVGEFDGVAAIDDMPVDIEEFSHDVQDAYDTLKQPLALTGIRVPLEGIDNWDTLSVDEQIAAEQGQADQITAIGQELFVKKAESGAVPTTASVLLYAYRGAVHSGNQVYNIEPDGVMHPLLGAQALRDLFMWVGDSATVYALE